MASESQRKMKAIVKDPEHCSRVVRSLQSFNSQQSYTDLCFVCAHGIKVYAHKLLVCSVSTLLKELLLQLPDNLSKITIHVPDIDSRILQLIVHLLYEGNVRISRRDYEKFKDIMNFLGIVLEPPSKTDDDTGRGEDPPPPSPAPTAPAPQVLYMPNPSSSQGGVQYVLAPSSMVQGSLMSPVVQPSSVAQHLIIPASTAQVQAGNQMVQLVQSQGGQMVPFGSQMVQTINGQMVQPVNSQMVQPVNSQMVQPVNSQMIQPVNSQMVQPVNSQMVQPVNSQMVQPINSQMVQPVNSQMVQPVNSQMVRPANQTVQSVNRQMILPDSQMFQSANNEILQPDSNHTLLQTATQMVNGARMAIQNNRHTIINNNTTQVNLQNQSEARGSASSIGFRQSDSGFSVQKRTHIRRPLSSATHQPNLATVRDRPIMRRRTGPIVTGVHSIANLPGNRSHTGVVPGIGSGTGTGQLVRRSQNSYM